MIGQVGQLSGEYVVIGQVDHVLPVGEELPTLRLTRDAPPTPIELEALREVVQHFVEPAKALGVSISKSDASIQGPALWLTPVAIFR